jgi:twitching motility two-component system response regulator PilH
MPIRKILVCDDGATDRANLERVLVAAGYEVTCVDSGGAAVERAHAERPDLIFMDVNMDGMDGFAATRALQKDPSTVNVPIVMVTSKNQKADHLWARMQGARGFVAKPYRDAQIIEQIILLEVAAGAA